ncbi:MAG: hypothetical protein APU95_01915 [Hadesarchaea archaeon YNP_N21]|nr:MAG: hypothetical protein APU95_01915 [Hadesarchaea archaeon YNP_N21]
MFKSKEAPAISDIIRSMLRMGFSKDDIYDVFAGVGLPGEQVQLLIDRISAEFYESNLESRATKLSSELSQIFKEELHCVQQALFSKMDLISIELQFLKGEVEKLNRRIIDKKRAHPRAAAD